MLMKRWLQTFPILVLIPYLITGFINGYEISLTNKKPEISMYVSLILEKEVKKYNQMELMEDEAIKALAIITRTNLYRKMKNQSIIEILREEFKESGKNTNCLDRIKMDSDYYMCCKAVEETEGKVLLYNGQFKMLPYHMINNGKTRDGEEILRSKEYTYLKSVDSEWDKNSEQFINNRYLFLKQIENDINIIEEDEYGYAMQMSVEGKTINAERLRRKLGLTSTDITIQKTKNRIYFLSKGKGHGLGYSQYGGNQMAKKGKTWKEILKWYFPKMDIRNFS